MKLYGLKRNYNAFEDARVEGVAGKKSQRTTWKKTLHRKARRVAKINVRFIDLR